MTNAQEVFDAAMGLMDEVNETTGSADNQDTKEYKDRTLFILNVLRGELYPYSAREEGAAKICPVIEDFAGPIGLDDYLCQTVMPYGLAAHLLLDENPSSAGFFQQRYEELKRQLSTGPISGSEDITDCYGGLEPYNEFGMWS